MTPVRLLLLIGIALGFTSLADTNSHPERLRVLESLTNPPPGFRLVFHRTDAAGDSSFYDIIGQSNSWRGKYAPRLEDLNNPIVSIQGGSLPNRQWVIKGNKTNDWNNAHRRQLLRMGNPFPELPNHGKLTGGYLWAFTALSLGIAPVLPGTVELKGTNFSTFYEGAEHVGHFDIDSSGRLTSASMLIRNSGNVTEFKIRYTFRADRFQGEFPSVIEVYRGRKPSVKYEILKYEPRGWYLPDSAFDIDGAGRELSF